MQPSILWSSTVSVFIIERTAIIHSLKCTVPFSLVVPLLSLAVTHCYLFSLFVTRCITPCHSLSLVAPLVVIRCHSFSFIVALVVTRCTIRCHLMYHSSVFLQTIIKSNSFDFIHYTEIIFLSKSVIFRYISKIFFHILKIFFTMLHQKIFLKYWIILYIFRISLYVTSP